MKKKIQVWFTPQQMHFISHVLDVAEADYREQPETLKEIDDLRSHLIDAMNRALQRSGLKPVGPDELKTRLVKDDD